jgi:hypothetical protein
MHEKDPVPAVQKLPILSRLKIAIATLVYGLRVRIERALDKEEGFSKELEDDIIREFEAREHEAPTDGTKAVLLEEILQKRYFCLMTAEELKKREHGDRRYFFAKAGIAN